MLARPFSVLHARHTRACFTGVSPFLFYRGKIQLLVAEFLVRIVPCARILIHGVTKDAERRAQFLAPKGEKKRKKKKNLKLSMTKKSVIVNSWLEKFGKKKEKSKRRREQENRER